MGKIEYVGIENGFFNDYAQTETHIEIPENAHYLVNENWIDMSNPLNWLIVAIPIILITIIPIIIKQKKNGILNKEIKKEYIEKYSTKTRLLNFLKFLLMIVFLFGIIGVIILTPIHELIHCLAGSLVGLDMKWGIDLQNFMAFAYTNDEVTKMQFLIFSLTPLVIMGIIPLIILFIKYPKRKMDFNKGLKYWTLALFCLSLILSTCPDMIESFNYIKNIPNNAKVADEYWYIPNEDD